MTAVRIVSCELQWSTARGDSALSVDYCYTIELLLDFLDNIMLRFPAWAVTLVPLKGSLTTAVNSSILLGQRGPVKARH
ncbi:hypothetical protein DL93DRAFT_2086170 [Clavulina sp. PMI_390]|nr:hypothetical protein DL93DRAFT_2086170 [Clavulina sp. PMI_390]